MKNIYATLKFIRLLIILFGIPFILIEVLSPGLLDFSHLLGDTAFFGARLDVLCQVIVIGSELTERVWKLKEARLHLFSPLMALSIRRLRQ